MTTNRVSAVKIEGTRLVFRNFSGEKGKFNKDGRREFGVVLPRELALQMKDDGWNVKQFRAREDDVEEPEFYILVKIGEKGNPPKLVMINSRGRVDIPVGEADILDWVTVAEADLIINPFHWDVDGNTGISAYLRSLYITVDEDELERKYADVPDADSSTFTDEEAPF